MPSHTFQLARPEDGSAGGDSQLPQYTRDPKLPSYLQPRDSMAVTISDEKHAEYTVPSKGRATPSLSTMIPQALLVDASASLSAYLYFTSLQARMALQQQSSLDLLSTLCSSLPEDVDTSLLHTCAHAISHEAENLIAAQTSYSHRLAILIVLLKAFLGFMLLTHFSKVVKPFDFLVASGAVHCLVLYLMVFVPVANLMYSAGMANGTVWLRVMSKILWLVALCCVVALVQWGVQLRKRNATLLVDNETDDGLLDPEQNKSAISLA